MQKQKKMEVGENKSTNFENKEEKSDKLDKRKEIR